MNAIQAILEQCPQEMWDKSRELSHKTTKNLFRMGWYHNKCYDWNDSNDGQKIQITKKGKHSEIPYNRKLFYQSPEGRFSLGSTERVAYFSNEWITSFMEVTEKYHNIDKITWNELCSDIYGHTNPEPNFYGYPICVKISEKATILDLKHHYNPLVIWLSKNLYKSSEDLYNSMIISQDKESYIQTQNIASAAFKQGFQGILYTSVVAQKLTDVKIRDWNLIIFDRSIVIKNPYNHDITRTMTSTRKEAQAEKSFFERNPFEFFATGVSSKPSS